MTTTAKGSLSLLVIGVLVLTAYAVTRTGSSGPLLREHSTTISRAPVQDGTEIVSIGSALIGNRTSQEAVLLKVQPVPNAGGLEIVGIGVTPVPHTPGPSGVGTAHGFPPAVRPFDDVDGYRLAPGERVQVVFGVRLLEPHDQGGFPSMRITYRIGDRTYQDVFHNGVELEREDAGRSGRSPAAVNHAETAARRNPPSALR